MLPQVQTMKPAKVCKCGRSAAVANEDEEPNEISLAFLGRGYSYAASLGYRQGFPSTQKPHCEQTCLGCY